MKNIRVLMVDDTVELVNMINEYFNNHMDISLVLKANDGMQGFDLIKNHQKEYDVLLLDLMIPKKDGLTILKEMKNLGINKKIIVLTSYTSEKVIKETLSYKIDYLLLKPCELSSLEDRIYECVREKEYLPQSCDYRKNSLHISITKLLRDLGVPSNIKGYQYIREGISILYSTPQKSGSFTKSVYSSIAQKFETNIPCVERSIRHAIEVSWNRGNWDLMEEIFGHSVDLEKAKPTNSEFLTAIADKLQLEFQSV